MWHFTDSCGWSSKASILGHNYCFVFVVVSSTGLHTSCGIITSLSPTGFVFSPFYYFSAVNSWSSSDISSVSFRCGSSRSFRSGLFFAQPTFWWTLLMVSFFFSIDRSNWALRVVSDPWLWCPRHSIRNGILTFCLTWKIVESWLKVARVTHPSSYILLNTFSLWRVCCAPSSTACLILIWMVLHCWFVKPLCR